MLKKWSSSLQSARDVWRRKLGLFLFDKKKSGVELTAPLKRVVLVRWDAKIGDSIVSSFVFREWRKTYPNIIIDVITTPSMVRFFKEYLGADNVYEINKRPKYKALKKLAFDIGEADLLVHLSKSLKMKDLYFMSKSNVRLIAGVDDDVNMINVKLGCLTKNKHYAEKFKELLNITGVKDVDASYIIPFNKVSQCSVDDFLKKIKPPIVSFNPYGNGKSRQFNVEKINDIIRHILTIRSDVNIILLTSPDKKEEVFKICSKQDRVFFYEEAKTIDDTISIIRRSQWVVSVDTATTHIAIGENKPLLAFYNPDHENFNEWGYERDNVINFFSNDVNSINAIKDYNLPPILKNFLN